MGDRDSIQRFRFDHQSFSPIQSSPPLPAYVCWYCRHHWRRGDVRQTGGDAVRFWLFFLVLLSLAPLVYADRYNVTVFTTPTSSPNWTYLARAYDRNWSSYSYPSADNSPLYFTYNYLLPINLSHPVYIESKVLQTTIAGCTSLSCWNYTSSSWFALDTVCDLTPISNNISVPRACFNSGFTQSNFRVFSMTTSRFYEANISYISRELRNITNCLYPFNDITSFWAYNENTPTSSLNISFKIEGGLILDGVASQNFSYILNNSNRFHFCMNTSSEIWMDAYVQHIYPTGFTHRYYVMNESVSSLYPLNISLFNFIDTTGISDLKITVRNRATYQYLDNVYVSLQRRYVGEGVWRTVQMDLSDDFGLLHFNIIEETTDYKLIFMDSKGNILQTSETMKFICSSGLCEITYLLDPYSVSSVSNDLSIWSSYSNTTGLVTISWDDPSGRATAIDLSLSKETLTGINYICDTSIAGSTGSYDCNATGFTGPLYLRVSSTTNGIFNPEYSAFIETTSAGISSYMDQSEGALWTIGLVMVIGGIGFFSPVGVVLAAMFALIVSFAFGLISALTITGITIAVVLGIVIAVKVKQ